MKNILLKLTFSALFALYSLTGFTQPDGWNCDCDLDNIEWVCVATSGDEEASVPLCLAECLGLTIVDGECLPDDDWDLGCDCPWDGDPVCVELENESVVAFPNVCLADCFGLTVVDGDCEWDWDDWDDWGDDDDEDDDEDDDDCPKGKGYWKTHSEYGPSDYDEAWGELEEGADTEFFGSGSTYLDVLEISADGSLYLHLAHKYISVELNGLAGWELPEEVQDAMADAADLLDAYSGDMDIPEDSEDDEAAHDLKEILSDWLDCDDDDEDDDEDELWGGLFEDCDCDDEYAPVCVQVNDSTVLGVPNMCIAECLELPIVEGDCEFNEEDWEMDDEEDDEDDDDDCPKGKGYWKTHSEYGPANYDEAWGELEEGADTEFFGSGSTYLDVLEMSAGGSLYLHLAHKYISVELNGLAGWELPDEVQDAMADAADLLDAYGEDMDIPEDSEDEEAAQDLKEILSDWLDCDDDDEEDDGEEDEEGWQEEWEDWLELCECPDTLDVVCIMVNDSIVAAFPSACLAECLDLEIVDADCEWDSAGFNTDEVNLFAIQTNEQISQKAPLGNILAYPNPTDQKLNVSFESIDDQVVIVQLKNIAGVVVYENQIVAAKGFQQIQFNTASLESGFYLVSFTTRKGIQKVVTIMKL